MKKLSFILIPLLVFLVVGCSDDTASTQENVTEGLSTYYSNMEGGTSQVVTIDYDSLSSSVSTTTTATAAGVTSNDVYFYSSDQDALTVSPEFCTFTDSVRTCKLTFDSKNEYVDSEKEKSVSISYNDNGKSGTLLSLNIKSIHPDNRTVTFVNNCNFDVWMEFTGGNAATIACTQDGTAKGNCPTGQICFNNTIKGGTYCVEGSVANQNNNIDSYSEITPSASCSHIPESAGFNIGQCECSSDANCSEGQKCLDSFSSGSTQYKQCFYAADSFKLNNDTKNSNLWTPVFSSKGINSGNWYAKTGCDENGANCISDKNLSTPSTLFEFTLQKNSQDYLDISYINGTNMPMAVYPATKKAYPFAPNSANDEFFCSPIGGTSELFEKLGSSVNESLKDFSCSYDYNIYDTNASLRIFNFVTEDKNQTCTEDSNCSGGQVCGLTFDALKEVNSTVPAVTTCGNRAGYHTYASICSVNSDFIYSENGVELNCADNDTMAFALCKGDMNASAGKSCYNFNTTSPGDECCGYVDWSYGNDLIPKAMEPQIDVDRSFWYENIPDVLQYTKYACPISYSYQYDDPYATMTCSTELNTINKINRVSYIVDMCPSKNQGGINPNGAAPSMKKNIVPYNEMNATVPAYVSVNQFLATASNGDSIASVKYCDTDDTCTDKGQAININSPTYDLKGDIIKGTLNFYASGYYEVTIRNIFDDNISCIFDVRMGVASANGSIAKIAPDSYCDTVVIGDAATHKEVGDAHIDYNQSITFPLLPRPILNTDVVLAAPAKYDVYKCSDKSDANCLSSIETNHAGDQSETVFDINSTQTQAGYYKIDYNATNTSSVDVNVSCFMYIADKNISYNHYVSQAEGCYQANIQDNTITVKISDFNTAPVPAMLENAIIFESSTAFNPGGVITVVADKMSFLKVLNGQTSKLYFNPENNSSTKVDLSTTTLMDLNCSLSNLQDNTITLDTTGTLNCQNVLSVTGKTVTLDITQWPAP